MNALKFVETLETSGLPAAQARAISAAVKESHEAVDVATKRDLDDVRKELKADIEMLRKDLIIKFGAMLVIAVGALAAIIKLPL